MAKIKPKFCAINHETFKDQLICERNVNKIIKKTAVKVKGCERLMDVDVSGHSLRVGTAQYLLTRVYAWQPLCAPAAGQMQVQC